MENEQILSNDDSVKEIKNIPHIAIITVNAIVNQQLPNGHYHPRAVYNDAFSIQIMGNNEQECIDALKTRLERIKDDA